MDLLARQQQPSLTHRFGTRSDGAISGCGPFRHPHQSGTWHQHGALQRPAGHGGGKRLAHSSQMRCGGANGDRRHAGAALHMLLLILICFTVGAACAG